MCINLRDLSGLKNAYRLENEETFAFSVSLSGTDLLGVLRVGSLSNLNISAKIFNNSCSYYSAGRISKEYN